MTNKPRAPRKTKTAEAIDATIKAEAPQAESLFDNDPAHKAFSWTDYVKSLNDRFGEPTVTWKRELAAWTLGLAASIGVGYVLGFVIEVVMIGVMAVTGSATLAILSWVAGLILAMYAGAQASTLVYTAVRTKGVDRAYENAKTTITGWFTTTQGVTA